MTTGSRNTIIGRYNGNQGGLDIRTSSNNIVLSDGDGNPRLHSSGVISGDGSGLTGVGGSTTTGAVGTYALLIEDSLNRPTLNPGATQAGSSLKYSFVGSNYPAGWSSTSPSGTWRLMGGYSSNPADNDYPSSVWLRIS